MKKVVYLIARAPQTLSSSTSLSRSYNQSANWDVCVILTPYATRFVDQERLTQLTGHPIRSDYKRSEDPDVLPPADAVLVYPTTFNTINKWALGISDTLALGLLCEFTGLKLPILVIPVVREGKLAAHPAFPRSLRMLRRYGVHMLYDTEIYPPRNERSNYDIVDELQRMMEIK